MRRVMTASSAATSHGRHAVEHQGMNVHVEVQRRAAVRIADPRRDPAALELDRA